ncbi:MAG: SCO family protein [Ginsengibacter sp.]|jgi:protein SCO1/2
MKSIFALFTAAIFLLSCNNSSKKSAFEGSTSTNVTTAVGTIPDQSIFMLKDTFESQQKKELVLADLGGKPTVMAMIFTHCDYACPRLTADIKTLEEKLKAEDGKINFVLVSFDSDRDTAAQLLKYAKSLNLDKNWTLLHGDEEAVRTLSVLLNIQFEKNAEGNFSHSNIISVLGKDGMLVYQKEGLEANQDQTLSTIRGLLE